jgi:hypothetical protein
MGLELGCNNSFNNNSLSKFAIKHIINTLSLSKAIESSSKRNRGRTTKNKRVRWSNYLRMPFSPLSFTWSDEISPGIGGLLSAGLLHAGLLHVSAADAPVGADQGRWPHLHRTDWWGHHHWDWLGRRCSVRRCHRLVHPTTQELKSILSDWLGHRRTSLHSRWPGQEEPLQQKKKGGNRRWNPWCGVRLISRSVTDRLHPTT